MFARINTVWVIIALVTFCWLAVVIHHVPSLVKLPHRQPRPCWWVRQ